MSQKKIKRYRALGKVFFWAYFVFLVYFLCFAEWYGRTGVTQEYRYNFELFKEIRRFIEYREELGIFAVFANLFGNILIFVPFGFSIAVASSNRGFLKTIVVSY